MSSKPTNGNGKKKAALGRDLQSLVNDLRSSRHTIEAAMDGMAENTIAAVEETERMRSLVDRALSSLNAVLIEMEAQAKELNVSEGGSGAFNFHRILMVTKEQRERYKDMNAEHDEIVLAREILTGKKKEAPQSAAEAIFPDAARGSGSETPTPPAATPNSLPKGKDK